MSKQVRQITGALFDDVTASAAASPRLRMNHNFHSGPEDNPHRFLNVLLKGTYIRPHRHLDPPKPEAFLVLEGAADVIVFDDNGNITDRYRLGSETPEGRLWGVDIAPGVWHTILPRSERAVCFEVKPGPWQPATDKEFAAWAPAENDPGAAAYCKALLE
ncbi:MAG TPA: WbuC family cupin fold metalloprotein [Bryobacteraceae bacterium]|jgi:cupin fold WbuC family metalloprotein|nr:WbuC family cupin fold metalloprotein [Bryobacteraceae bacterium]